MRVVARAVAQKAREGLAAGCRMVLSTLHYRPTDRMLCIGHQPPCTRQTSPAAAERKRSTSRIQPDSRRGTTRRVAAGRDSGGGRSPWRGTPIGPRDPRSTTQHKSAADVAAWPQVSACAGRISLLRRALHACKVYTCTVLNDHGKPRYICTVGLRIHNSNLSGSSVPYIPGIVLIGLNPSTHSTVIHSSVY